MTTPHHLYMYMCMQKFGYNSNRQKVKRTTLIYGYDDACCIERLCMAYSCDTNNGYKH